MATPCLPHQGDDGNAGVRVVALRDGAALPFGLGVENLCFLAVFGLCHPECTDEEVTHYRSAVKPQCYKSNGFIYW